MIAPADISTAIDARNSALLLLVLASAGLCPDASASLSRKVQIRWGRLKGTLRSFLAKDRPESGSFWEIDMTKFEP